jgi:DNA-binding PadR family transcriptional regulator
MVPCKRIIEEGKKKVNASGKKETRVRLSELSQEILIVIKTEGRSYARGIGSTINSRRTKPDHVEKSCLYKALRSLQTKGLVKICEIEKQENAPDRKYYSLTQQGRERVEQIAEYRKLLVG